MKNSLKIVLLSLVAAYPALAAAEVAGASLPSALSGSTGIGYFVVTMIVLSFIADYARRARSLRVPAASAIVRRVPARLLPAPEAFGSNKPTRAQRNRRVSALAGF